MIIILLSFFWVLPILLKVLRNGLFLLVLALDDVNCVIFPSHSFYFFSYAKMLDHVKVCIYAHMYRGQELSVRSTIFFGMPA